MKMAAGDLAIGALQGLFQEATPVSRNMRVGYCNNLFDKIQEAMLMLIEWGGGARA